MGPSSEALPHVYRAVQEENDSRGHFRKFYDLCQHVVMTCPCCNSVKPRPERSRVSGLRAGEFGGLIFLDHGSGKIGDKTFECLIVLDGATSHLTAYPCKSTSPSEVVAELHEWMDTFLNPKATCADMAFHHAHDMKACHRMHNVKRISTGPHTPWPNRAEMGVRLFKTCLLALVDTASKKPGRDHSGKNHSCPVDARGSDGEKYTSDLKWQDAHGIGHGTQTKRSPGLSFHEPSTAYIHANQARPPQ